MNNSRPLFFYSALFTLIFSIDRFSKYFVVNYLHETYAINNFFSFCPVLNRGISWGMLQFHDSFSFWLLSACIIAVIGIFAWYSYRQWLLGHSLFGETLVLAGAISNGVDRFMYEGVIDFLLVRFGSWCFPVFNIADVAIVFGVLYMAYDSYKSS